MINEIITMLNGHPDIAYAKLTGDGKHYDLIVVSEVFQGQSAVQRQLWVYALLKPYIASGVLHAVQMNTWTKAEWETHVG